MAARPISPFTTPSLLSHWRGWPMAGRRRHGDLAWASRGTRKAGELVEAAPSPLAPAITSDSSGNDEGEGRSSSTGSGADSGPQSLASAITLPGTSGRPSPLPANRILVQWRPDSTLRERRAALTALGAQLVGTIHSPLMRARGLGPVEVITLPRGLSSQRAINAYRSRARVLLAETDGVVGVQATANDPYYSGTGELWGMYSSDRPSAVGPTGTSNGFGSQAEQAWARGYTGSSRAVVGVIDTGIDYTHPDLYLNIWLNPAEIPSSLRTALVDGDGDGLLGFRDLNAQWNALRLQGSPLPSWLSDWNGNGCIDAGDLLDNRSGWEDGIDADGNGYADDLIGWDFFNNSNDPFRPSDGDKHGTHVAGTIGGIGGNGIGVAGVNWAVQIMPLKFLGPSGGYTSAAISAVQYYANITSRQDVDFGGAAQYVGTSNSWGGGTYNSTLHSAIITAAGVDNLFIAAAGNSSADNDLTARYPANYSTLTGPAGSQPLSWEAVVSVAALDSNGSLASYSNWGRTTVDLGAPGSTIISTVPGGYGSLSGTSMATPHVSGAIALYAAANPTATPQQILEALYGSVAATDSLAGKTRTGGRLDVNAMLAVSPSLTLPLISLSAAPAAVAENGTTAISYSFSRSGDLSAPLTVGYSVGGTASAGLDYTGLSSPGSAQQISFAAGSSTVVLLIQPIADSLGEADETVELSLTTGNDYLIGTTAPVVGTIVDASLPSVSLTLTSSAVNEDGTDNLVFTFTRSAASSSPLTVSFSVGGTASAGIDYSGLASAALSQTVTIAAHASSTSVVIDPIADSAVETNETVNFTLLSDTGYTVATAGSLTGTILNDDSSPTQTFTSSQDSLTGSAASDIFRLSRLSDALWSSNPDRISSLQAGTDQIDTPSSRSTAITPRQLAAVKTLDAAGIAALLTSKTFNKNGAATFTYADPVLGNRAFLAINDATAGYNAGSDAVLEITGYSGSLSNLAIL